MQGTLASIVDTRLPGKHSTLAKSAMNVRARTRLARLAMDARHHLERRDLYRAKANGPDAVSAERLRDLERAYELAAERLAAAEADPGARYDGTFRPLRRLYRRLAEADG